MKDCIFCKIANKEIPKEMTYESERVMVFPDIHPVRPVHLLVIPKKHIKDFVAFTNDKDLWQELRVVIQKMIKKEGLDNKGYRLGVNGGGAQLIDHLHIHIVGPVKKTESV